MTRILLASLLAAATALPAAAEPAPAPPTLRFRGTVTAADNDRIEIRRAGGSTLALQMTPTTRVFAVVAARARNIKPESYVSVLGAPGPEPRRATAVALYSPSERGFEAGSQAWDTAPGATLTAGWVADLARADPVRLTLAYGGGHAAFEIPRGTPITQVAPGEKALLQPGAAVTVFARSEPGGALQAGTIAVGRQGAVPAL